MFLLPDLRPSSVVCFIVHGLSDAGVQAAPGLALCLIQLALFLFGKLLIRGEIFYNAISSFLRQLA